jgi:hypothetical protein
MLEMYSHSENIRSLSHAPILEGLTKLSTEALQYLEQEKRLKLSSMIVRKRALAEELRLKRGVFDEKERIAITHYIDALRKRSTSLLSRAETVATHFQNISLTIKKEFESLEGAVQGILPPNLITKILQWSSVHMQRALREPTLIASAAVAMNAASSSATVDSGVSVGGVSAMTRIGSVSSLTSSSLTGGGSLSTSHHQKLSLTKPSPSLSEQMIPKHHTSSHSEISSKMNPSQFSKSLPPVKPDPFNRYFTSSDSLSNPSSSVGLRKK